MPKPASDSTTTLHVLGLSDDVVVTNVNIAACGVRWVCSETETLSIVDQHQKTS